LFAAYRALARESIVTSHVDELVKLIAAIVRSGVKEGAFSKVDAIAAGRAVSSSRARRRVDRPVDP
jgi:hypothetical protein